MRMSLTTQVATRICSLARASSAAEKHAISKPLSLNREQRLERTSSSSSTRITSAGFVTLPVSEDTRTHNPGQPSLSQAYTGMAHGPTSQATRATRPMAQITCLPTAGATGLIDADASRTKRPRDNGDERPFVVIVDDDEDVRDSLEALFLSVHLDAITFPTPSRFLGAPLPDRPRCLVLDVRLPGESGLDLQVRLGAAGVHLPIIFITGHADVPMSVQAMRRGAVNFLTKPFRDQDLLDAVREALDFDARRRAVEGALSELRHRARTLTPREVDVLKALDRGLLNKQIAHELGIAEITVKMHRSNATQKLGAKSVPDLIHKVRSLALGSVPAASVRL
jgi:FixJ family two-component response regulator